MSKLVLCDESKGWRIRWVDEEDGEGGAVGDAWGEALPKKAPDPNKDKDDWEVWVVEKALEVLDSKPDRDMEGYYWESKSQAQAALRVAKAALQQPKPMPDWAVKASAAGWKPPKGWKP